MTRWWLSLGFAAGFAVLAISVHVGLLNDVDSVIREWARPHDVWGPAQLRADVVHGLRPRLLAGILAVLTAARCLRSRSLRPVIFVGSVCFATVALTVVTKTVMGRLDPHGLPTKAMEAASRPVI
jgi:hypothetical protein